MNLQPLKYADQVSAEEFSQILGDRLKGRLARALVVHKTLGELHSYRVTNILHLGLQKGIEDKVLETLEEWCEVVQHAPDEVTAHVDTRLLFDAMYQEHFVRPGDTIGGFDFSTVPRIISPSGLWIPGS